MKIGQEFETLKGDQRGHTFLDRKKLLFERLKGDYLPPYITFFKKMPYISKLSPLLQFLIYISVLFVINYSITVVTRVTEYLLDWWLYFMVFLAIVGFGLWALWYARQKLIDNLADLLDMMTYPKQIGQLESCLKSMYVSSIQTLIILMLVVVEAVLFYTINIKISLIVKFYIAIYVFLALIISGFGLWLAISSIYFVYRFTRIGKIKVNAIFPDRTVGIVKLANMMATYATLFALEVSLWVIPFILITMTLGKRTPPVDKNSLSYQIATSLMLGFAIIIVPLYFLYPQLMLRGIVLDRKSATMRDIQTRIEKLYTKEGLHTTKELMTIREYAQLLADINRSSNSPLFNINIGIRFISSTALSIFMAASSNPQMLIRILDVIRVFFGIK